MKTDEMNVVKEFIEKINLMGFSADINISEKSMFVDMPKIVTKIELSIFKATPQEFNTQWNDTIVSFSTSNNFQNVPSAL